MSIRRIALGFSLLTGILSPAAAQQRTIVIPDNLFTQAGFVVKYATTPEKAAILRSLPPDKLVTRRKDGKLYYVYADAAAAIAPTWARRRPLPDTRTGQALAAMLPAASPGHPYKRSIPMSVTRTYPRTSATAWRAFFSRTFRIPVLRSSQWHRSTQNAPDTTQATYDPNGQKARRCISGSRTVT